MVRERPKGERRWVGRRKKAPPLYNGSAMDSIDPNDRPRATGENEPMLYCPVCSTRLTELKCKLVCDKCGYYMSCADYY